MALNTTRKNIKLFRKLDFYLLFAIVIVSLVIIFILNSEESVIEKVLVYKDSHMILEIRKNGIYYIKDKTGKTLMSVEFKDGKVRVVDSTCPLKLCVKQGWVSKPYKEIICVPNRIVIKPVGRKKGEIDIETW